MPFIKLAELDECQRLIIWPMSEYRLSRNFFQKRVVKERAAHIKAFAAEALTGVLTCLWFCKLMLRPLNKMGEYCTGLELLQLVHDILFHLGDRAVRQADLLASTLVVHHQVFLRLYGADAVKIKFHLLHHIPGCLKRFGTCLHCFKPERMHKSVNTTHWQVALSIN